jgi:hypothetical protein
MRSYVKPWKIFFSYLFTWLAAVLMAAATAAFILFFQPGVLWLLIALSADAAGAALWFVIAFKSEAFRRRLNRMPYEDRGREVTELVRDCPEQFRRPALESINLIRRIESEFTGRTYSTELTLMLDNIHELTKSHRTLWIRSREFGDAAQKKRMDALLAGQVAAVNGALATLRTFSGNLTLLEANEERSRAATDELKDINEGLKEVIKEL